MTTTEHPARAVTDPVGLITDLITRVEKDLDPAAVRGVVLCVAGGRAKSRRLAEALEARPEVLTDGRSPALRAIGDLLIALRKAGAVTITPPVCRDCGKHLRTFQRRGQDWYCSVCGQETAECAVCGNTRRISMRDRTGRPRCSMCPDTDPRDPLDVIHEVVTGISPTADRAIVAEAVRRSVSRPSYQQKLAWSLEDNPRLLTGEGHLAPSAPSRGSSNCCTPLVSQAWSGPPVPAADASSASTSPSTASGSAATASPSPASRSAHAAAPGASRPPATPRGGRCVRTA
ncbi:hypothetical protein GCM10020000_83690 [Streptomyces olivoverticillatus]